MSRMSHPSLLPGLKRSTDHIRTASVSEPDPRSSDCANGVPKVRLVDEPVSQSYVNHIAATAIGLCRTRSSFLNVSTILQRRWSRWRRISAENPATAKFGETRSDARGAEESG